MSGLAHELKMSRPFSLPEEEASLAILRTADVLQQRAADVLKGFFITTSQYNVLRILRGSPDGLACCRISERLLTNDPDVTRLLDRMEGRRWIKRKRSLTDRRVVIAALTPAGNELLEQVTPVINSFHRQQFGGWGEKQLKQLIDLLAQIRATKPQMKQETKR